MMSMDRTATLTLKHGAFLLTCLKKVFYLLQKGQEMKMKMNPQQLIYCIHRKRTRERSMIL